MAQNVSGLLYHLNRENGKEFKAKVVPKKPYQNSASGDS